jgi:SAM-dependent methyltransferase
VVNRLPANRRPAATGAVFSDADAAALYDLLNPWDPGRFPGDRFYHELVMAADSVLDVGCGTGAMLACARDHGHCGRLTGLDPDRAALDRARRRAGIEWAEGAAAEVRWQADFDLATMTGHAFQCLLTDHDLHASLTAIRAALRPGGRFVFETRHPQARPGRTGTRHTGRTSPTWPAAPCASGTRSSPSPAMW